jgi:predicted amino acid-binding ACT domain protein
MSKYFPRMIGMAPDGKFSEDKLFELLVLGMDRLGALSKLTTLLAQHKVNIIPSGGYSIWKPGTFIWTTFADFSRTKSPVEYVLRDLKRIDFVTEAKAKKLNGTHIDQFLFPVYLLNSFRGVIFSIEPLLGVERRLIEQIGPPGEVILFEEGRNYAIETLGQLVEAFPNTRQEALLENVVAWLRTTGWGLFEFAASRLEEAGELGVVVTEPPIAVIHGLRKSNFLNGVAAGVIEAVYKRRMKLESELYDSAKKSLVLLFRNFD